MKLVIKNINKPIYVKSTSNTSISISPTMVFKSKE